MSMHRPRKLTLAATALILAAAVGMPGPAGASPAFPRRPDAPGTAAASGRPVGTVTLITGDRVTVTADPQGRLGASARPGPGREKIGFQTVSTGKDRLTVFPSDAFPLIAAGKLDRRLFDVGLLVRDGYTDERRADIPVIAQRADRSAPVTLPGATTTRSLGGKLGMDVLKVKRTKAAEAWRGLTGGLSLAAKRSPKAALGDGVQRLWLDGKVRASLDRSAAQVGAPAAWQRGFTGKNVTVAVLDTGIDASHPDLAGKVTVSRDFTGSASGVQDKRGHGTHVASIIAGTGAASAGKYKGIAPDAKLAVGKVLGDDGYGYDSWIAAGIEWAASVAGAKVANLSLGGVDTPGLDPMETAVSAYSGTTLFVVAAGNIGPDGKTVTSTPGSADPALTVGAVDRSDQLAPFSQHDPAEADFGFRSIKPNLTAPGVDIAAARATGTSMGTPVDDKYTRASGTSMATPHVAGAAAVLAERRPGWRPQWLGRALEAAAVPTPNLSAYSQGSGRLDVARALDTTLFAQSTYSVALPWPHDSGQTGQRCVALENPRTEPLTVDVSVKSFTKNGQPGPAGLYSVDTPQVTIPAGEYACALVAWHAGGVAPGHYYAEVTARTTDGAAQVRTMVGTYLEPELFDLTIAATDRSGGPGQAAVEVYDWAAGNFHSRTFTGTGTLRLPAGRYTAYGSITTGEEQSLFMRNIQLGPAARLDLDARQAKPVGVRVDETDAKSLGAGIELISAYNNFSVGVGYGNWRDDGDRLFTVFPVQDADISYASITRWVKRGVTGNPPYIYHVVDSRRGGIPESPGVLARKQDMTHVKSTYRAVGVAATGEFTRWVIPGDLHGQSNTWFPVSYPATIDEYMTAGPERRWMVQTSVHPPGQPGTTSWTGYRSGYPAGDRGVQDWNTAPFGPAFSGGYHQITRQGDTLLYETANGLLTAGETTGQDWSTGGWDDVAANVLTLDKDGQRIATANLQWGTTYGFPAPSAQSTYTLTVKSTRNVPYAALSTSVESAWTFKSAQVSGKQVLPLAVTRWSIPAGLDTFNRAAAWSSFRVCAATQYQTGGPQNAISSFKAEASFNDGQSWMAMGNSSGCPAGQRSLNAWNAAASGYVSLRATITDSAGNKNVTTILRAYKIGA